MVTTRSVSATNNKENVDRCLNIKMRRVAEQSLTKTIAKADKKREEEKRRLAEEKAVKEQAATEKREEEKNWENRRKDQEEAAGLATRKNTPGEGNTAGNTSPPTNLGGEGEDAAGQLTDPWEAGVSPERKKTKQSVPVATPVIKSGRYAVAKVATPTSRPLHDHVHKRVILDAALDLNKDNPITSFTNGLCVLINNAKMVDEHL
jgi:hypothetical protein